MKRLLVAALALALGASTLVAGVERARAQDKASSLDKRVDQLEQRLVALEQENTRLRDVVRVSANRTLTLDAANLTLRGGTNMEIRSGGNLRMEAATTAILKGALVTIN